MCLASSNNLLLVLQNAPKRIFSTNSRSSGQPKNDAKTLFFHPPSPFHGNCRNCNSIGICTASRMQVQLPLLYTFIVRDKVTRQCPQTTTFEEKGEPKQIGPEVPLLTSLTPYRQAKPAHDCSTADGDVYTSHCEAKDILPRACVTTLNTVFYVHVTFSPYLPVLCGAMPSLCELFLPQKYMIRRMKAVVDTQGD